MARVISFYLPEYPWNYSKPCLLCHCLGPSSNTWHTWTLRYWHIISHEKGLSRQGNFSLRCDFAIHTKAWHMNLQIYRLCVYICMWQTLNSERIKDRVYRTKCGHVDITSVLNHLQIRSGTHARHVNVARAGELLWVHTWNYHSEFSKINYFPLFPYSYSTPWTHKNTCPALLAKHNMVSCQKGPTRHGYVWSIGPFWQDTLDMSCADITATRNTEDAFSWLWHK